jgi:ethanolamine ammonia-lyase large subunit
VVAKGVFTSGFVEITEEDTVAFWTQHSGGTTYQFDGLVDLLAKATPARSGDELAGCAAGSDAERAAAQWALADVPLTLFLEELVVPYESDEVTRLIIDRHDPVAFTPVAHLTVGGFRDWLLEIAARPGAALVLSALAPGLTPEMVAAVSKLMRNQDLITVARAVEVVTAFRTTIGLPGRLSTRLQPNHPTDDPRGIAAATLDGLLLGSGDAVIGINPATDSPQACADLLHLLDEVRLRYEIPTQSCVLTHVTTTIGLVEAGVPVDLVFQSVAGTEAANRGFGVDLAVLREGNEAGRSLNRGTAGNNVMYIETGQGSALSAGAHLGTGGRPVDQQTLEVRAYAVARELEPLLLNTVVGFIGPEYLYDGKQIIRAGLEDHFCGKLLGVPMGVDVCYTNHAEADQDDMDTLLTLLGVAGCSFVIAVPGADDVMLGYQSTSFHDALYVRQVLGLRAAPEFETWLQTLGMVDDVGRILPMDVGASPLRALAASR